MPVPSLAVLNTSAAKIFSTTWCLAEVLFRQLILRRAEVCHFIDASHAPLLIAVLLFKLRVTYLVLGEAKKDKYLSLWRLALRSGRIKLIVETAEVKKSWDEINRDSVFEIPVAVSSIGSDCIQEHCRQELGIPLDAYVLLFFGTHRESKDYVTPLQGVLRFASSERPWLLFAGPVISGDDPGLLVRNSALKEAVVINRFIPDEEAGLFFNAANLVVLSYGRNYWKGSAVLLQAVQYQKPLLVSGEGHLENFVRNWNVGLAFESCNASSFEEAIRSFKSLPPNELSIFKQNLAFARERFSWSTIIDEYMRIWEGY